MSAGAVSYRTERTTSRFLDPRTGFEPAEAESEVRYDPLTGDTARICHFSLKSAPPVDLSDVIESTREGCPFCPDKVLEVTPRFEEDLVEGGRVTRGEAVVFPNLFPYDDYSAIGVVSHDHALPIGDMPTGKLADVLIAARTFLSIVDARTQDQGIVSYPLVTWNFMPPSGGSQIHPHIQVIHTQRPVNTLRRRLAAESDWRERHDDPYMAALIEAERSNGARWIGDTGSVGWWAPFQPTGMLGDCAAVFPEMATITDLTDDDIENFVEGLRRVLAGFADMGFVSFNLVFSSDQASADPDRHWVTAQVVPRFYVNPANRATDAAYLQFVVHENFAMVYPEETAARLRERWG